MSAPNKRIVLYSYRSCSFYQTSKNDSLNSSAMSFVRVWIHLVFSTKHREAFLTKEIRTNLHNHIIKNCKEKKIFLKTINGYTDHIHCLIALEKGQCISDIARLIKGESSYWINNQKLTKDIFSWQDDYFAASVSESNIERVTAYIKNQEAHHSKISFEEESDFMKRKLFTPAVKATSEIQQ